MTKKGNKENDTIDILYTIIAIRPYNRMKDHLEIWLSPVDPLLGEKEQPTIEHEITFPGGPNPEHFIKTMVSQMKEEFESEERGNDRDICLVLPQQIFKEKNWRYGATINAKFEQVDEIQ
jgi:hypothetical protein